MKQAASFYLIAVTVVATMGGLLFGFDMAVISGVLPFVKMRFALSPAAEGWFVSSALLGCITGVAFSGELSDRLGRKRMLMLSAVLFLLSALGTALSPSFAVLITARMIGGAGVGVASIVAPLYISEIAPAAIRGRMVTFYQLAVTGGILVAYLTNAALLNLSLSHQGERLGSLLDYVLLKEVWRSMLGLGVLPSLVFLLGLFFVPESPRWLIQQGKQQEGLDVLTRIEPGRAALDAATISAEKLPETAHETPQNRYKDLLSPALRKPLLLGLLLPLFSQFSGINAVIYYGPRILHDAGITLNNALLGQIFFGLTNFVFTLVAVWKVDQLGRRPLYLFGSLGAALALIFTGICFKTGLTANLALVISIMAFLACFA